MFKTSISYLTYCLVTNRSIFYITSSKLINLCNARQIKVKNSVGMGENTRLGWGRIPGWDGGEYQVGMGENTRMGWGRIPGWAKIFVRHVFYGFFADLHRRLYFRTNPKLEIMRSISFIKSYP